jgi:CRP/FNR family cyclic AMP-dependent transcriptional regulator
LASAGPVLAAVDDARSLRSEGIMKRKNQLPLFTIDSHSLAASFGDAPCQYRKEQIIYSQGAPADTLFYSQEGGVRLTTRSKFQPPVGTAILGVGDFFGEPCLLGFPRRMSTAVALTASSIQVIQKGSIIRKLRQKNKVSNSFLLYLLSNMKKYRDHVAEVLTLSAKQRLACVLLRLAQLDRRGSPIEGVTAVSQQVLAEMVGTTRSRLNLFMNQFRERGFINYSSRQIEVRESLRRVLRCH